MKTSEYRYFNGLKYNRIDNKCTNKQQAISYAAHRRRNGYYARIIKFGIGLKTCWCVYQRKRNNKNNRP